MFGRYAGAMVPCFRRCACRPALLIALAATALQALASAACAAEPAEVPERGAQGLVEVPFAAENRAPGPISCSAVLAHWYSLDLGRAKPGGTVRAALWYDPAKGGVFLLNKAHDRMPVQTLWCGLAGRSWATRTQVVLEQKAAAVPAPIRLTCRAEGEQLACR